MEKRINSKTRAIRLRWFALGCLAGVAGMWVVCAIGLRVNGTASEPVGIYWAVSKVPGKGDLVFVMPPPMPIFKLAKERGYLAPGPSPALSDNAESWSFPSSCFRFWLLMPANLPLNEMSLEEKLQAMEALWEDLSREPDLTSLIAPLQQ